MIANDPSSDEEVLSTVRNALCEVVPERFAASILKRSAELRQESNSDDTDVVRGFIDGPLRAALRERFGEQLARLGASQVRNALGIKKRFDSQIRGTLKDEPVGEPATLKEPESSTEELLRPSEAHDGPATKPLPQLDGRSLFFVSPEESAPDDLVNSVGQDINVRGVKHLSNLPQSPASASGTSVSDSLRGVVIVVDCRRAPASALGFGLSAPSFGAGLVILWGTHDLLGDATHQVLRHPNWIRCGPDVEAAELGMLVRAFSTPRTNT